MPARKQPKDFEAAIARLDQITELLEAGEASLEKAIDLYTEGLEISRFCSEKLSEAEKKIRVIAEKSGLQTEVDFDEGDS